jgi:hypothetical protein
MATEILSALEVKPFSETFALGSQGRSTAREKHGHIVALVPRGEVIRNLLYQRARLCGLLR